MNSEPASPVQSNQNRKESISMFVNPPDLIANLHAPARTRIAPTATGVRACPICDQGIPGVGPEDSDGSEDSGVSFSLAS